jgi:hypothetical protein
MRQAEQAIMTKLGFANIQQFGADQTMPNHDMLGHRKEPNG